MWQRFISWVIVFIWAATVCAQYNEMHFYKTSDGMTGNELVIPPAAGISQQIWTAVIGNKINILSNGFFKILGLQDGLVDEDIDLIQFDKFGNAWLTHYDIGVSVFHRQKLQSFYVGKEIKAGESVLGMFHWQGQPCIFTNHGLVYPCNDSFTILKSPFKIDFLKKEEVILNILESDKANLHYLWVRNSITNSTTIIYQNGQQQERITYPPITVQSLKIINGKYLLAIASNTNQCWVYQDKIWKKIDFPIEKSILWHKMNIQLLKSANQECFFAFKNLEKPQEYDIFELTKDLKFENKCHLLCPYMLNGVCKDKQNLLWFATGNGLLKVYPSFVNYNATKYPTLGDLHVVMEDNQGNPFFGSYKQGFSYLNQGQFRKISKFQRVLPANLLLNDGCRLFSVEDTTGIVYNKGDYWEVVSIKPYNPVGYYLLKLSGNRIGFGTAGHGLAVSSGSTLTALKKDWKFLNAAKGYPFGNVLSAVEDNFGRIWMGKLNHGIAVYLPLLDTVLSWKVNKKFWY